MNFRFSVFALFALAFSGVLSVAVLPAQSLFSRSGVTPPEGGPALRTFPCAGTTVFEETFSEALSGTTPAGWTIYNLDLPTPAPDMDSAGYANGWHVRPSFKDANNTTVASLSYFKDTTAHANNWLISPPVTIGANTCFSWYAYSQDVYYPERYLVRASRTKPSDPAALEAAFSFTDTVWGEVYTVNYRSRALEGWINADSTDTLHTGDTIYLAFQHISKNKFFLVLDDIRVAEVPTQDAGIMTPEPVYIEEAGDAAYFYFPLRNYGIDSLKLDTITLHYRINGGHVVTQQLVDSFYLAPNDTMMIRHDSTWTAADTNEYRIEMWASGFTDLNPANDTARGWVYIGFTTGIPAVEQTAFALWPNPADEQVYLRLAGEGSGMLTVSVTDLTGRLLLQETGPSEKYIENPLNINSLQEGVYLITVSRAGAAAATRRLMVH